MQTYMRRVILEQPEDPLSFLIRSIRDDPYTPAQAAAAAAEASRRTTASGVVIEVVDDGSSNHPPKHFSEMDLRRPKTKYNAAGALFDIVDTKKTGTLLSAELIVYLRQNEDALLRFFPKHRHVIIPALEEAGTKNSSPLTKHEFAVIVCGVVNQ